ncbi:hypothetical protein E2C01_083404 [Portunus trituberculatus]|uniref:Uncharacterized protein n=1 Tax=Portunus trituberculatus TaxID=210409 RepID=A0A5B7J6I2_PORTR|nr:hypothetical protein [Portunus trituberculatus]
MFSQRGEGASEPRIRLSSKPFRSSSHPSHNLQGTITHISLRDLRHSMVGPLKGFWRSMTIPVCVCQE